MEVAASCPGKELLKVLLAGGYTVLDKANAGLVVATQSRIYSVASPLLAEGLPEELRITVLSPQFDVHNRWEYTLLQQKAGCWHLTQSSSDAKSALLPTHSKGCLVTILADNDFYSQTDPNPGRWHKIGGNLKQAPKTGLGSSAAMTCSLMAALSTFLSPDQQPLQKTVLHALSQYAHSLAQGKIGSGFDVSAAIFGSQIYNRFDPSCLSALLERDLTDLTGEELYKAIVEDGSWDDSRTAAQVNPIELPPMTTLLLAEVNAGSHTPSLVGNVLKWRKQNPEKAQQVWDSIDQTNKQIASLFEQMCRDYVDDHAKYTRQATDYADKALNSDSKFCKLENTLRSFRQQMKAMGNAAAVEIEPDSQTLLLNATSHIPGFIGGAVPGAGGFDAIYVLLATPPGNNTALETVEEMWRSYKDIKVKPLSPSSRVFGKGVATAAESTSAAETVHGVWVGSVAAVPELKRRLQTLACN